MGLPQFQPVDPVILSYPPELPSPGSTSAPVLVSPPSFRFTPSSLPLLAARPPKPWRRRVGCWCSAPALRSLGEGGLDVDSGLRRWMPALRSLWRSRVRSSSDAWILPPPPLPTLGPLPTV